MLIAMTVSQNAILKRIQVLMAHTGGFWRPVQCGYFGLTIISLPWVFYQPPGDFYTPDPFQIRKKYFKPRMVCDPVRLCLQPPYCFYCVYRVTVHTLPTLSRSVPPYPLCYSLAILYPHKSTSSPMCMAGDRSGKGSLDQACAQIVQLVSNGNDW